MALSLAALACSACSDATPTKDQILTRAHEAFAADQFIKAEKDYREVLRLAPNDRMALRQLGILYLDQGQVLQAYPLLSKAAELQPDDLDLQLKLGLASLALRQLIPAREAAQHILMKKPGDESALILLIDTAGTPDEIRDTQQLIERRREQDQPRASYHLALGLLYLRQQDNERAETELNAALTLGPQSASAWYALGSLHWSRNELKAADAAMRKAFDLNPLRSPTRLRYVDFKLRTGALPEAKKILEDLNTQRPDFLPPRVYLMRIACAERLDPTCAARVQAVLAQDPTNVDAVFQDSMRSLTTGNTAKAIQQLEYLNNVYRERPRLLHQLAVAYLAFAGRASPVDARDAVDKAASRLSEAIKLDPRFSEAILMYAELQIRSGKAAVVLDSLVQLVKEQPLIVEAHYLLVAAYRAVQKDAEALAVLQQMAERFPDNPQPPFAAGSILLAQGQRPQARKEFERSAAISQDYLPAIEALVNLDLADNQYAAALERVQHQIDKHAAIAQLWGLRAKIYFAQQDLTRAEADLLKAIELDPKLEPAYLLLAQLYASSNRHEQAIARLNGFIKTNKTVPALLQLARIHEQVKNFPAARDAYETLLTVSANDAPALNNLAVLLSEHFGQLDAAHDLARRAREADPNQPSIADTLGWILFKKGDYVNALRLLQEAAAKQADRPAVQFRVGMAHYMLGEEAAARIALQTAADASGDSSQKVEARQRLTLLAIDTDTANPTTRTDLDNFLRERPNDPAALLRRARLQLRDGAADQAIKTLETLVTTNPIYRPALRQLALLYGERLADDDPKAYELVQRARQAYPEDVDVAKTLGIFAYRRQLFAQSAQLLEAAARTRPDDADLLYHLGSAHQQLKQWKPCMPALERALNGQLSPAIAEKAKQILADCTEAATP
jgi:tetratricopeptide (TPR) repeat protein